MGLLSRIIAQGDDIAEMISNMKPLTKSELDMAKVVDMKIMQREMFKEELDKLQQGQPIKAGPSGTKDLYLDPKGIIMSRGRIEQRLDPLTGRDQILVNGYHPFVQAYIRFKHKHLNYSSKEHNSHGKERIGSSGGQVG